MNRYANILYLVQKIISVGRLHVLNPGLYIVFSLALLEATLFQAAEEKDMFLPSDSIILLH